MMITRPTVLALVAAMSLTAAAHAAPHGRLIQNAGPSGCVNASGASGCTRAHGIAGPAGAAVSPDGRNVYVAAFESNAIAIFRRDPRNGVAPAAAR